jgi:hypothetical protein
VSSRWLENSTLVPVATRRVIVGLGFGGQTLHSGAVGVHHVDLVVAVAVAAERDPLPVP